MRSPVFSCIALALFIAVFLASTELISRETFMHEYREKFHVEPRVSSDGIFRIDRCGHKPEMNVNAWVPNHTRSFRAVSARVGSANAEMIYIEQAQPRMCYKLEGEKVLQNIREVYWLSATTLGFVVEHARGDREEYLVDIRTLSSTHHPEQERSAMQKFGQDGRLID